MLINYFNVLSNEAQSPGNKVMSLWHFIKGYCANASHAVQLLKRDISALPLCHDFDDALRNLEAMDYLQSELYTIQSPFTDLDIITIHINKLAPHDRFNNVKIKYLQPNLSRSVDNHQIPSSFKAPPLLQSKQATPPARGMTTDMTSTDMLSPATPTSMSALATYHDPTALDPHYAMRALTNPTRPPTAPLANNMINYVVEISVISALDTTGCQPNDIATTHQLARDRRLASNFPSRHSSGQSTSHPNPNAAKPDYRDPEYQKSLQQWLSTKPQPPALSQCRTLLQPPLNCLNLPNSSLPSSND